MLDVSRPVVDVVAVVTAPTDDRLCTTSRTSTLAALRIISRSTPNPPLPTVPPPNKPDGDADIPAVIPLTPASNTLDPDGDDDNTPPPAPTKLDALPFRILYAVPEVHKGDGVRVLLRPRPDPDSPPPTEAIGTLDECACPFPFSCDVRRGTSRGLPGLP